MADILAVIPVYNHGNTLRQVAEGVLARNIRLLVVDDGSAAPVAPLLEGLPLDIVRHEKNQGKGAAIMTAARWAGERGYSHLITLDADGQHDPVEAPKFSQRIQAAPHAFIVGARDFKNARDVPFSSRFGRVFSEFWMFIQTARRVSDMQSGYRAYPVPALLGLSLWDSHYSFEVEVLVKAAWAGFEIAEFPISVYYPKASERISHFRAFRDNVRISALNTRLTIRALIPVPFKKLSWDKNDRVTVRHPLKSLRTLLEGHSTARSLALSTLAPILVCSLPILGFQSLLVLFLIAFFKLNRLWALAVAHACVPPLMPAFCIEIGHYVNNGFWLTDISWQTLGREVFDRFWDWLAGAAVGGPLLAFGLSFIVYLAARLIGRGLRGAAFGRAKA